MSETTVSFTLIDPAGVKKALSIQNPKSGLKATDFNDFVDAYNDAYAADYSLLKADYVTTSRTNIYTAS